MRARARIGGRVRVRAGVRELGGRARIEAAAKLDEVARLLGGSPLLVHLVAADA